MKWNDASLRAGIRNRRFSPAGEYKEYGLSGELE